MSGQWGAVGGSGGQWGAVGDSGGQWGAVGDSGGQWGAGGQAEVCVYVPQSECVFLLPKRGL